MATTYSFLLERKNPTEETLNLVAGILNKGYTYDVVRGAIFEAFYNHKPFPFDRFNQRINQNLLQQNKFLRYYHKELLLRNGFSEEVHDVDTGNITSSPVEFWVEPRASYTMDDLLAYFKKNIPYRQSQYSDNRLRGIFERYVKELGIDVTLFMIEHAIKMNGYEKTEFDYRRFDDYQPKAHEYLEENKNGVAYSGGAEYVSRKRMLLD